MQSTALFGGTFNPVHTGHLRVAEEVLEGFGLDRVYFIPAANPPHKSKRELAPAADRYEMLMRAVAGNPAFEVSDLELQRSGSSYTIDTVEQFLTGRPGGDFTCRLVMGMDAFAEIHTWRSYRQLLGRIEVIVISRPSDGGRDDLVAGISEVISDRLGENYKFDEKDKRFVHPEKCAVYPFAVTALDISASLIRSLTAAGSSIKYLVPEAVEAYIHEKGLYL